MSSIRGPQDSAHNLWKMLTAFETTRPRCSGRGDSRILSASVRAWSFGSKWITSFVRWRGMWFSRMSSTRPPCGSTTVTPAPAAMSVAIMFRRSVDLRAPVAPKIAMCLRRASGGMAKASPRSKMPSSLMPIRREVIIGVNALKFTGEGIAEQLLSNNARPCLGANRVDLIPTLVFALVTFLCHTSLREVKCGKNKRRIIIGRSTSLLGRGDEVVAMGRHTNGQSDDSFVFHPPGNTGWVYRGRQASERLRVASRPLLDWYGLSFDHGRHLDEAISAEPRAISAL